MAETQLSPSIVAYTAIAGGYDVLRPIPPAIRGVEFVCLTDDLRLNASGWRSRLLPNSGSSVQARCRWAKFFPDVLFPDHEYSIYIDGNIEVIGPISALIDELQDFAIAMYEHPFRQCAYDEATECELIGFDQPESIRRQLNRYRLEGFPSKYGLYEANVIVRLHRDPALQRAMRLWWNEWQSGVKRDQLSLTYVLWKEDVAVRNMGRHDARFVHRYFRHHPHEGPVKGPPIRRLRGLVNRIRRGARLS